MSRATAISSRFPLSRVRLATNRKGYENQWWESENLIHFGNMIQFHSFVYLLERMKGETRYLLFGVRI